MYVGVRVDVTVRRVCARFQRKNLRIRCLSMLMLILLMHKRGKFKLSSCQGVKASRCQGVKVTRYQGDKVPRY